MQTDLLWISTYEYLPKSKVTCARNFTRIGRALRGGTQKRAPPQRGAPFTQEATFGQAADSLFFPRESAIVGARIIWTRPSTIGQHPRWYVTASQRFCSDLWPRVIALELSSIFFAEYPLRPSTPRLRFVVSSPPAPRVSHSWSLFLHLATTTLLLRIAQLYPCDIRSEFRIRDGLYPDRWPRDITRGTQTREIPPSWYPHEWKYISQRVMVHLAWLPTRNVLGRGGRANASLLISEVLCRLDHDATLPGLRICA